MTAFQVITLSGTGEAETPEGGSVCMRYQVQSAKCYHNAKSIFATLKSRINRLLAGEDIFAVLA